MRTPPREAREQPAGRNGGKGLLGSFWQGLRAQLDLQHFLRNQLGFTIFLTLIGLLYVANAHHAEYQARREQKLKEELKALKSEAFTLNARLSRARKQSEVAEVVDTLGLQPLTSPPHRIHLQEARPTTSAHR